MVQRIPGVAGKRMEGNPAGAGPGCQVQQGGAGPLPGKDEKIRNDMEDREVR